MAHRTRSEQLAVKARKDPNKLAKVTRVHKPKNVYKRQKYTTDQGVSYYENAD